MDKKKTASSRGASKPAKKADPVPFASTKNGSRTFAQSFTVMWTPSATCAVLTVTIKAGGSLLTSNTFTPDTATQRVSGSDGTFSVDGLLIAAFDSSGRTGTLLAQPLSFDAPATGQQAFSGAIGLW